MLGAEIGGSDDDIAKKFLQATAKHKKMVEKLRRLEDGIEYLECHEAIDNVHVRRGLACLLIVAGRFTEADLHLRECMREALDGTRKPAWLEEYTESLEDLINLLEKDPNLARQYLIEIECKNKDAFGIR